MRKYGNILIAFVNEGQSLQSIERILYDSGTDYLQLNNAFFVQTLSKTSTGKLIDEIKNTEITFVFYHINLSHGSKVVTNEINRDAVAQINKILLKETS